MDFSKFVLSVSKEEQKEWSQKLYLIKDKINPIDYYTILVSLYKNIYHFENENGFLTVSARDRIYSVMAYLFSNTDKQDEFIATMNNDINKLEVIDEMIYWIGDNNESAKNKLNDYAKGICDNVMENNQDDLYEPHNIWAIYHTLKRCNVENRETKLQEYIVKIISPKNIYRILRDTVGRRIGEQYGYRIVKENYDAIISDKINVQGLLIEHKPNNTSEELIYKLYQNYSLYGDDMDRVEWRPSPFEFDI